MEVMKLTLLLLFVSVTRGAIIMRNEEGNCTRRLDVIAVVDGSDSIIDEDFSKLKSALIKLAEWLELGNESQRFGAVVFSSSISDKANLTSDIDSLKSQITAFGHPKMGTSTHLGVQEMIKMFEENGREGVPQVGIVITDGRSINPSATQVAADEAKALGINMISVGIGVGVNKTELSGIATNKSNVRYIENFDQLEPLVTSLVKKHCIVDGKWSAWSDATEGPCSVTCGEGVRSLSYNRTCTNPPPKNGGKICQGLSSKKETGDCKLDECPIDGGWTGWTTTEGECSVTCGGGVRTVSQTRTCTDPAPQFGGALCNGSKTKQYTAVCGIITCPGGDPCSGCRYHNGVGYMPHPSDCRYFLQCVYGASYFVMPCPSGLYWEQSHLTCTESRERCTADIPEDDPEQVPTVTWSGTCDGKTRYIAGSSGEYEEDVPNIGWVTRQCGPGTVYNTAICTCVHGNNSVASTCSPQVYLPFRGNVNDESGHNTHVHNAGVDITLSNQASFINDAYLRINRFSNMDFGKTLVITFLMTKGASTAGDQAIVSNAECEEGGSVYIIMRNNGSVEFRVFNKEGAKHSLAVQYTVPSRGLTPVSLVIDEGSMVVRVNNLEKSMPFNGSIGKSHCAVEIGKGNGFVGYVGLVDDFKLYLCKP